MLERNMSIQPRRAKSLESNCGITEMGVSANERS
jgi:hypothetical protein